MHEINVYRNRNSSGATTLKTTTFGIMALSIVGLISAFGIDDLQHMYYNECSIFAFSGMLNAVMLKVVIPIVVAPFSFFFQSLHQKL